MADSGAIKITPPPHAGPLPKGDTSLLRLEQNDHIHELARQGLGIKAIARATGFDKKTVRKYLNGAPPAPAPRTRKGARIIDPYRDWIRSRLAEYPELTTRRLYHEIQEFGYPGKETQVKKFVRSIRQDRAIRAVWRFETPPGEQAQVDWAHVRTLLVDGRPRRVYAFVMVLGYSRYRFVKFVTEQDAAALVALHLEAFAFLGGVPRTCLYDNMKTVIIERGEGPDQRVWNALFRDFFQTLGFRPHLCAPYRAQTKGKVERSIRYLREGFLDGREFASVEQMNVEVQAWLRKINHERPNDTTGRIPAELLAEEKLTPLDPSRPYVITQAFARRVNRECLVYFQGNRYSVPWRFVGREAMVRLTGRAITIEVAGEVVARHDQRAGSGRVVKVNEHFDGLLPAIRSMNRGDEQWRTIRHVLEAVAQRPLDEYDRLIEEVDP